MYGYNPMQARADSLMQQKQMIEQQLQQLQQFNVPPININNQITPASQGNFDFNGKWVSGEQEARQFANSNLPTILFDNNEPVFYMKNMDGSFKKFRFSEIVEQPQVSADSRIEALESKMDAILGALGQKTVEDKQETKTAEKKPKKGESA